MFNRVTSSPMQTQFAKLDEKINEVDRKIQKLMQLQAWLFFVGSAFTILLTSVAVTMCISNAVIFSAAGTPYYEIIYNSFFNAQMGLIGIGTALFFLVFLGASWVVRKNMDKINNQYISTAIENRV